MQAQSSTIPAERVCKVQQLVKFYFDRRLSLGKIEALTGISKTTIRDKLRNAGYKLRTGPETRCLRATTSEIKRLYDSGLLPAEIGKRLGITRGAVLSRLIRVGHPMRRRGGVKGHLRRPDATLDKAVTLWNGGLHDYSAIGKKLGVSRTTAKNRLKAAGLTLPRRDHKLTIIKKRTIAALYKDGVPVERIAERLGAGLGAIYRTLDEERIERRGRSASSKKLWATRKQKLAAYDADLLSEPDKIAIQVEKLIPSDKKDQRRAIVVAREQICRETRKEYSTVAQNHSRWRQRNNYAAV